MGRVPLSGSADGAPIALQTTLTAIETAPLAGSVSCILNVSNVGGAQRTVTFDVGGTQFSFTLGANTVRKFTLTVSNGVAIQASGSVVDEITVFGSSNFEPRYVS